MAIIQFSNGQKVQFDGNPTPADIEEVSKSLNIQTQPADAQPQESKIGGFFKGVAKGVGSTIKGIGDLGAKGLRAIAPAQEIRKTGYTSPISQESVTPTTAAQKVGFGAEQIAELFIPAGKVVKPLVVAAKGVKALSTAPKAIKGLSFLARAAGGATEMGGARFLQTGGNLEETKNAVLGGAIGEAVIAPVVSKTLSFIAKRLPERFFSTFFKTTDDDLVRQLKTSNIVKLQQTKPDLYQKFVDQGIIKFTKGGVPEVDQTLARQALERGFGTAKTGRNLLSMADYSYSKQLELESDIVELLGKSSKPSATGAVTMQAPSALQPNKFWISFGTKSNSKQAYVTLLENLTKDLEKTGFGKTGFMVDEAQGAREMLNILKATKGNAIAPDVALRLRRTIDGLRNTSSFRLDPSLSKSQGALKNAANYLRGKLAEIPELKSLMKEYKFYIDAFDTLAEQAAKAKNQKILTLFDAIVGGTSMAALNPVGGLGLMASIRTVQSPAIMTFLGQQLNKMQSVAPAIERAVTPITTKAVSSFQTNKENL